nr:MAG TPA: hypothetical protein [Caudoviricetes sp.]
MRSILHGEGWVNLYRFYLWKPPVQLNFHNREIKILR